jgi:hypothetical protein
MTAQPAGNGWRSKNSHITWLAEIENVVGPVTDSI